MKKGFTLVELLAVIVIIGVVALIAVPSIMKNISESKESLYTTQVQNIELAAKKWATDSTSLLDSEYLNSSFVSVKMLQDLDYLSREKINNPKTGEAMYGCIEVTYDATNKSYTYTYDDGNIDCASQGPAGYYYQKDAEGVWQKDLSKQRESIFSYLVGNDNENVVVTGSGLYDMEDRYVFRGNVTNNYVKLDNRYYRILSLDKMTKSLKLVRVDYSPAVWDASGNIGFNVSTLYTENLNKSLYPSITNQNVKWNVGVIDVIESLNLNAARTYETKTQIVSEIGLISMSEYMEASINSDCSSGILSSCSLDTYLDMADSWTLTTTSSSVVYIDANKGLSYETDLINALHNIHYVLNIVSSEKSGSGTYADPFIITV